MCCGLLRQIKAVMVQWEGGNMNEMVGGGESMNDLMQRIGLALADIRSKWQGKQVVVVAHALVNKAVIAKVGPWGAKSVARVPQHNGAVNVIDLYPSSKVICNAEILAIDLTTIEHPRL